MRTIVAGCRRGARYRDVELAIRESGWSDEITVVISGGAMGVDIWGETWAQQHGREIERFPIDEADWCLHGKAAGPMRNRRMAEAADALIAVWDGESRGTRNMIHEARQRDLRVQVYRLPRPSDGDSE